MRFIESKTQKEMFFAICAVKERGVAQIEIYRQHLKRMNLPAEEYLSEEEQLRFLAADIDTDRNTIRNKKVGVSVTFKSLKRAHIKPLEVHKLITLYEQDESPKLRAQATKSGLAFRDLLLTLPGNLK
jgi:hypothetical protein